MSARRRLSHAKKPHPRLNRFLDWGRSHQTQLGLWGFSIGFLLVTFPSLYKAITTSVPQPSVAVAPPETTNQPIEPGPFRIDEKLLGITTPTQPPLRVVVPTKKVDLSIVEAPVINGYWELSETTASHGVGSANPGQNGNIVVFAHARNNLFGPLRDIKKNEIIYILTKDRWFRYMVEDTKLVDPTQIENIKPTDSEQLTLFTCSGFLDSKRLIVMAKPLMP